MTSHVHLIIDRKEGRTEDIIRDLKRHTSKTLLKNIDEDPQESRKKWMLWMFERAGRKNPPPLPQVLRSATCGYY